MFGFLNKATDPVCNMKVDKKTEYFSDYQGSKYYFCSENCKNQFNAEPAKFVRQDTVSQNCCQQKY